MRTPGNCGEVAQPSASPSAPDRARGTGHAGSRRRDGCGSSPRLRDDVEIFDFQQVAGLGALDIYRTGQGVGNFGVEVTRSATVMPGLIWQSEASRVSRTTSSPRSTSRDRRNIGVPAVVPGMGLFLETLAAVNGDDLHGCSFMAGVQLVHLGRRSTKRCTIGTGSDRVRCSNHRCGSDRQGALCGDAVAIGLRCAIAVNRV